MLITKEAGWPLWARLSAEFLFWIMLPISLPIVIWLAMKQAEREVNVDQDDQFRGEAS
ncbi:hypothetical protein D3C87_1193950 [compost metagenome]